MAMVTPYKIRHIQLDAEADFNLPNLNQHGYYLLFWWKEIPLGDLYIQQNESIDNLRQRVAKAIAPAIRQYNKNGSVKDFENPFVQVDDDNFKRAMDEIFEPYLAKELPATVDLSIIICTRNRSNDLKICLDALQLQKVKAKEIIVVDNAPVDESTLHLTQEYQNTIYIKEPHAGLSIARNTGVRNATSTIVAWIDDDVVPHPLWSYQVYQTFENTEIAAMTGLVIASELQTESQQLFEKYWSFNRGYFSKTYDEKYFVNALINGPKVWDIGAGANMAFRKKVFQKIGFFDERLGAGASGCSEDSEYWFRLLANGFTIQYNPIAVVHHKHRQQFTELNRQIYCYMKGFAAAALIQQQQIKKGGYYKVLYKDLPTYFGKRFLKNSIRKKQRNKTLNAEIKGWISGIIFYYNNRKTPSQTQPAAHGF